MEPSTGTTRRKVVLAGAWTAPVILAAIAAPAASASASGARTIVLISDPETVPVGGAFLPISVQVAENGNPVGADEAVIFQITSGNATFEDGSPTVQITSTYDDGQATAFGLIAGNAPGVVTILVSSGSATTVISMAIA